MTAASTRVLAVIDSLEVGGAQHHLLMLSRGLAARGYSVTVATSGQEALAERFERENVPVHVLTSRSIKHRVSPVFVARLAHLARRGTFDLIHAHLHSASVAAAVAARVSGCPLVVTHHSMNTWRRGMNRALGQWADRQADSAIGVASNVAAGLRAKRVHTIRNGVHIPEREWSDDDIAAARRELAIPRDAYLIGYVGRLTIDKNPLLFVEAAALVATRLPHAHFLIVGDGPLRAAAEARARALGVDGRIAFAGFRPAAAELHPVADVLALSSDSEACPLVSLEAMAAGRPVVGTAVGDVPLQILDGETGFVVPPRDPRAMASALVALGDASLRRRLGDAGRQRVKKEFPIDRSFDRTVEVYEEALDRAPRALPAGHGSLGSMQDGRSRPPVPGT